MAMEHIADAVSAEAEKFKSSTLPEKKKLPHFSISLKKLVIFSIVTFGLYQLYWFYKQHRAAAKRDERPVVSLGKSLLAIFFCFQLFNKILKDAKAKGYSIKNESVLLGIMFIVLWLIGTGGGVAVYSLWSLFSVIPLAYVQHAADFLNKHHDAEHTVEKTWSAHEIAASILGGIVLLSMFAQSFVSPW